MTNNRKNIIFNSTQTLLEQLANELQIFSESKKKIHISLSGGSTPNLLFDYLAKSAFAETINWKQLHFWWGDERCVPKDDPESNYGQCKQRLFDHIQIPAENIHRIHGEDSPIKETERYTQEMRFHLADSNNIPQFDWIILGVGGDGHTASIFPRNDQNPKKLSDNNTNENDAGEHNQLTFVATQPQTGQLRISKTAYLIKNCKRLTYLVVGENKADIIYKINTEIDTNVDNSKRYPAACITSKNGITEFYLDSTSAKNLIK